MVAEPITPGPNSGAPDDTARLAAGLAHEINNPAAVVRHDLEQIIAGRGEAAALARHALAALDRIVLLGQWLIHRSRATSADGTDVVLDLTMYLRDQPISALAGTIPPAPALQALHLVIIDDDPDVRAVMVEAAEAFHCEVAAFGAVADALAHVATGAPVDLVLCDLMMPDGGAEAWLGACAGNAPALAARTIVITGGPGSADALAFTNTHTERVLYKPFAMADVLAMASRLLS